ncbi:MAG: hypothetical protein QOH17_2471, partial [Pseudonocardiales bacterium]|nr:hypothetical protein [Pseudonocardiales bacterium]
MARARGAAALASTGATATAATERLRIPTNGPHDAEALDATFTPPKGTVDFGAVRVPVPGEGSVVVEPASEGRMQAVHVSVPEGRLSVSALAAPRNGGLWPDLAGEIDTSLREGGARVRSFTGEWGRELHATTDGATSVFVGVDGPRWMLYGVATGPTRDAVALDARLRRMLRGTVVVRGKAPYPVRTVLPLTDQSPVDGAEQTGAAPPTMTLRTSLAGTPVTNGATTNGATTNDAATNGAAAQMGEPVNGASTAGAPVLAGLRGQETGGTTPSAAPAGAPQAAGANGYPAAPNGVVPAGAAAGVPTAAAPVNGWAPTGGYPADATPALGGTSPYGVAPVGPATNGAGAYGVPSDGTGRYAVPPAGPPTGAYAFGPNGYGTQQPGPATNGAAPYGAHQPGPATNGAPYGVPTAGSNGYGVPQSGSATNVAPIYGAGPASHGPVGPPTNGAASYGVPPAGSATGATPYGVPPVGPPAGANAYGTGGYGAQQPGPVINGTGSYGTGTYGVPTNGAGGYDTGGYRPQPDAASNGAAIYGVPHAGSTPSAYSTGSYGLQVPAADGTATTYGAPPAGPVGGGNAYGTGSYGVPQRGQAADGASTSNGLSSAPTNGAASADPGTGETSAWKLGADPTTTGEHSRPAVPPGWAHETGSRRRRAVADSEQVAAPEPARPSEQAWAPSTPAAEPADPTPFTAPQRSSAPVEPPLDWRPSWADPDPTPVESAPATPDSAAWDPAASDWRPSWADPEPMPPAPSADPLFGPLTGGLDPLPEPTATWSHVVNRPQRPAAPPRPDDAGTPLFDAAY